MSNRYKIGTVVMVVNTLEDDFEPATVTYITKADGEDCYALRFMDGEEGCFGHDEVVYVSDRPLVVDGKPLFWTLNTVLHAQEHEFSKKPTPFRRRAMARLQLYVKARRAVETYLNGEPNFDLARAIDRLADAAEAFEANLVQASY